MNHSEIKDHAPSNSAISDAESTLPEATDPEIYRFQDGPMQSVPSPVSQALLLICEKCGKKAVEAQAPPNMPSSAQEAPRPQSENPSLTLQRLIKAHLKQTAATQPTNSQTLTPKQLRPLLSSCLNICPQGAITVALIPTANTPPEFFITDPNAPKAVCNELLSRVTESLRE